jgi:hypothetical protein
MEHHVGERDVHRVVLQGQPCDVADHQVPVGKAQSTEVLSGHLSIAGTLSVPMTRLISGASPAATKPVPVPTLTTSEAPFVPNTSAIF